MLSNAVYHKSYELGSPIEVQVWPDKIEILSHPGPVPPVNAVILSTHRRIVAREYRNRRIGDMLKELRLTEGRGTGFPTIYDAMEKNGSPPPIFQTDEQTYVLVTLPVREGESNLESNTVNDLIFKSMQDIVEFGNGAGNGAGEVAADIIGREVHDRVTEMLAILRDKKKRAELFKEMNLSNQTKNREKYIDPLLELGWIQKEFPEETNPNQRYQITESGKKILKLISEQ